MSSTAKAAEVHPVERQPCWMDSIVDYLRDQKLPDDPATAKAIKRKSVRYCLVQGYLYRKGKSLPLLRGLHPEDAKWALKEVHSSDYGDHSGGEALAHRVLRMGYFWPTLHEDARMYVRSCVSCQRVANLMHQPPEKLSIISSPYPFAVWGADLIGPLPAGTKQANYAVVAIDYFTRWVEAETLTHITEANTTAFIKKNVV